MNIIYVGRVWLSILSKGGVDSDIKFASVWTFVVVFETYRMLSSPGSTDHLNNLSGWLVITYMKCA